MHMLIYFDIRIKFMAYDLMTQWGRMAVTNPDDLSLISGPMWWKEKTNSCRLI